GVGMSRIDVGGNRAGTQTGYTAYGFSGQNRVLVEGINTTEGTSGAGFYVDYGSFEEVFLGTIAQDAEMPTPGVQSQMLGKSSGKATVQLNQNNKLIGYYQWGQKEQPNRLPSSTNSYTDLGSTLKQISGSWIYKGEWNSTLSNKMYAEVRYGVFGYYFPLLANT